MNSVAANEAAQAARISELEARLRQLECMECGGSELQHVQGCEYYEFGDVGASVAEPAGSQPQQVTADEALWRLNNTKAYRAGAKYPGPKQSEHVCSGPYTDARDCPVHGPSKEWAAHHCTVEKRTEPVAKRRMPCIGPRWCGTAGRICINCNEALHAKPGEVRT